MAAEHPSCRRRPSCGHQRLAECPLDVDDWRQVFYAYLAFLHQCSLIAEDAHAREEATSDG